MQNTVTVGIPVYNEENNIRQLIESVINQNSLSYTLEKIVVLSDNSTDKTEEIVHSMAAKYPLVTLVAYKDRKGKCNRLNQLFAMNESEILIAFDGDIGLSGPDVIENIVHCFKDQDVSLVGVNDIPVSAINIQQRIINTWYYIWRRIRVSYKNGQNIYNIHGNALVLRKKFAKTIQYPQGITADQDYLYLSAVQQKTKFAFAHNAIIYFYTPDTFSDFFSQTSRFLTEKDILYELFGTWIREEYHIPLIFTLKKIAEAAVADPIFTFLAVFMYLYLLLFLHQRDPLQKEGMWMQIPSTKKAIKL